MEEKKSMIGMTKTTALLVNKMGWQIAKAQRLNQNIANVETPGYKRVDIAPFEKVLNDQKLHKAHSLSIQDVQSSEEVTREGEVMKLVENVSDYQSNLQLFKKYLNLLKTVVGKNI
jgi:flagellar basal body rod protein FlgB